MTDPATVAALAALERVTHALSRREERPGQQQMAAAVARAIDSGRSVVVQAGTGTGKTLAYLVPAILSGTTTVVATATKALQDQLASTDLPFLSRHLGRPFDWAVLKGRRNYLCLQRVRELAGQLGADGQAALDLDDGTSQAVRAEITRLVEWAATTDTGDQADLATAPTDAGWRLVSVGSDECPGQARCPMGGPCFAEAARARAAAAQVVVVNLHLYGLDVATEGALLPEHQVVVIDEAHQTEDIMSDTITAELGPGRVGRVAAAAERILLEPDLLARLRHAGDALGDLLGHRLGQRVAWPLPDDLTGALTAIRLVLGDLLPALGALAREQRDQRVNGDVEQRALRANQLGLRLAESIDLALQAPDSSVPFVSGTAAAPRLEIAPLDVSEVLAAGVWSKRTAILTSATIPASLAVRLGLGDEVDRLDVGSPFDYPGNGLLYCAMHLPDPRHADFPSASHDELAALITAAGGRTLALFTSWRAMDAAADALRTRLDVRILTQRSMSKTALLRAFRDDEATCLFATAGFFQGVDVPGRTLSLVTIDRIPFPRPDDPLLSARRERIGARAFAEIDVPRAAMLLAQATGRLIRTAHDRGVVAVLDRRLGTASYRWDIIGALPPMRRTRHRADAEAFLAEITADPTPEITADQ